MALAHEAGLTGTTRDASEGERAEHVLRANWATVQEIATALLEHETLSGPALDELLAPVEPAPIDEIPVPQREPRR